MKRSINIFVISSIVVLAFVISLSLSGEAQSPSSDQEQIVALFKQCDAKFKEGDFQFLFKQFAVGGSIFGGGGQELVKFDSQESIDALAGRLMNAAANGYQEEHHSRDIDVTVSPDGNEAVATSYSDSKYRMSSSEAMTETTFRITTVLIKIDGRWKIFHVHASELKERS